MMTVTSNSLIVSQSVLYAYAIKTFSGKSPEQMYAADYADKKMLVEVDSSKERSDTLLALQRLAFGNGEPVTIDNGEGSRYGRFSLKLRAEKPNPFFDPKQEESENNRRYLTIGNKNLQGRGLFDKFYKEYSKFIREARIINLPVRMELSQLLSIDKTKWASVGDIRGLIKQTKYIVSNKTGLGDMTIEMMYI